ncbi:ABC transporter substrate-binding protein [Microlunatus soli]|uniref:Carbohydrate ABC transporter substrate-binding protein, CUT1 family n=1 Tax=Microlunatus soli TaxID=630515 RepID=A0A1H1Z4W7_9ACTN|nr:sugar ABC transporter substrate-binding protein [Microlunatus soli]SDT28781.1 carbohydrate ABC transporter substrate-binding protein, CUT1 family [Microlunatus soli]
MLSVAGATGLAALTLPLASCGNDPAGGGHTDHHGRTTLSWLMWSGGSEEQQSWLDAAATVHRSRPDLTLELQTSSFDDYFTNLGTRIAGDGAPCLVSMQSLRLGTFDETMVPLDDLIADRGIALDDFDPNALKALQSDGRQMALPYDNGPLLILYNKDMFRAGRVAEPEPDWTISDFEQTAKRLTRGRKYGYAAFPNSEPMLSMLATYNGAGAVTADRRLSLTDEAMIEAFGWYTGLVRDQRVAPEISGNTDNSTDQFLAGNAAMVTTGPWDILNVNAEADFTVGLVRLPAGPHGSRTLSAGSGFGIARSCTVPEKAFEAVQILTGQAQLTALGAQGRAFPARLAAQHAWYESAPKGAKAALSSALETATPLVTTENWTEVADGIGQYGGQAFNGEQSPRAVLEQLQSDFGDAP